MIIIFSYIFLLVSYLSLKIFGAFVRFGLGLLGLLWNLWIAYWTVAARRAEGRGMNPEQDGVS